jgi:hypothetical protein
MKTNSGELDIGMTISVVNFFESGLSLINQRRLNYQGSIKLQNLPCNIDIKYKWIGLNS